jgi:transposase InsO family protein
VLDTAPTINAFAAHYDFAIIIPDDTKAPLIARKLLLGNKPFAVLVPIDLMHLVYSPMGDNDLTSDHPLAKQKLRATRKLVFSQDNLIWLVSPAWPGVFQNEVFHSESFDCPPIGSVRQHWAGVFYSSKEVLLAEGLAPDMRTLRKPPSREALLVAQQADGECQTWSNELTTGPSTIVVGGCLVRAEDGLLIFRSDADPEQEGSGQLVLPFVFRRDVIFYAHRQKNHAREERLADFISRTYWWPSLRADVKSNLLDCHFCLVARARRLMAHQEYSSMKLTAPHQGYGLDIWGPTVLSAEGYRYILTIVDLFHGYVRFYPMRTKSAKEIMSVALNMLWWHTGLPNFILTDDDSNFRSDLCTEFCRLSNIETWRTAPYSPWELGRVERRHQDLNLAMKALLDKESWPHHIPGPAANAFNTLKSSVTGVAPAEVEYGFLPRGPLEQFSSLSIEEPSATDRKEMAEDRIRIDHHIAALRDSQRVFTQLALHHGERHRQAAVDRKNKDAKLATPELKVGDLVVVRRPKKVKGIPSKALIQWRGPYTITAISARGYVCSHEDGSSVTVSRPDISVYTASSALASDILQLEAAQPSNVPEFEPVKSWLLLNICRRSRAVSYFNSLVS